MRWRIKFEYIFTIEGGFIDIEAPSHAAAEHFAQSLEVYVVSIKPILRVKLC